MNRIIFLSLCVSLFFGCAAETVERKRPRRGPVKEVGYVEYGSGHIRYSIEGWKWIVASRRKTALKMMSRHCAPDLVPTITDEYTRVDADAPYAGQDINSSINSGGDHFVIEKYMHLLYECHLPNQVESSVSSTTVKSPVETIAPVESKK